VLVLKALHVLEDETSGLAVAISTSLRRVVYVCGDEIIREGASSDALYFIAAGKVNVIKRAAARQSVGQAAGCITGGSHAQEAPLTSLGAGTLFGEMPLRPAAPWSNPTLTLRNSNSNPTP
jgi:CRP-like cAMP-binding protein